MCCFGLCSIHLCIFAHVPLAYLLLTSSCTFFHPVRLNSNLSFSVNLSLTHPPLLLVFSFAYTCIMVLHCCIINICLYIDLCNLYVSFLNVRTMTDSLSTPHALFPQHYIHSMYSGMLFKWIIVIFPNLKGSFWPWSCNKKTSCSTVLRLLGWAGCGPFLRKDEFKCSVKFLLNSRFYK